ncbi:hypothetical protein EDEG_02727 [Edhazardia aedis USNM 41457]|uniref:PCI domain-containing protein n=1 Tax=Edhazardia aedis (strain USNM 41457) TaxID=1003232 RepID=J8ZT99_EDHAE|nr:hypothetical protein EDEG_02727 [Edhazardia aedis USNM 41457]|eukprot:EJW02903.1 hypothetical protein EDEG_02727 [Edhazardia aedis USNM 41457]
MDITNGVNSRIQEKDTASVITLFCMSKMTQRNLAQVDFNRIMYPFNKILHYQKKFFSDQENTENIESLLDLGLKELFPNNWSYPIFKQIVTNIHNACSAMRKTNVEKIAKKLQNIFRELLDDSQKSNNNMSAASLMMIRIFNILVNICQKIDNIKMVDNLFVVILSKNIDIRCVKDRKIFNLYLGKFYLKRNEIQKAHKAFLNVYKTKNDVFKSISSIYIAFTLVLLNKMPSKQFLDKYNLSDMDEFMHSIRNGKIVQFDHHLKSLQYIFMKIGLYHLMAVDAFYLCYRNLLYNVHLVFGNERKLFFNQILKVIEIMKIDLSEDMLISALINLIAKNKIKGYVNISRSVLVLRKEDPFPVE